MTATAVGTAPETTKTTEQLVEEILDLLAKPATDVGVNLDVDYFAV